MEDVITSEPSLHVIPAHECFALLRAMSVGRVAVALPDSAPLVVPVNFVLDGETVVFRTDPGSKLDALRLGPISFEVDWLDPYHHTGWSVLARGIGYEATPWEIEHLDLAPWAPGARAHWVRLVVTTITGRRLRAADAVRDGRGYL